MSIRRKLWLAIALSTFFVSISVVLTIYFQSKKMAVKEAEHILLENTQRLGIEFESAFSALEHSTKMLEGILKASFRPALLDHNEQGLDEFKKELEPVFDSILLSVRPFSLWWVLNPGLSEGKHTLSYWDADGKGSYTKEEEYNINEYDLSSPVMQWWVKAIEYDDYWTNPYFWENWEKELISYSKAIYSDGILIGVAGSDFYFHNLRKKTRSMCIFNTGYVYLMDSTYNLIIHPYDEGRNLEDIISVEDFINIDDLLKSNKDGLITYDYKGKDRIAGFSKLSNGWILCASPPKAEVYAQVGKMSIILMSLLLVAFVFAWSIAFVLGKKLTNPLYLLMAHFKKGEQGDFTDRINYKSKDEIGELAKHFNFFMQKIEELVGDLKNTEDELIEAKIKAEESNELKTALLRNISHEIRTPLNAIQGFSSLISQNEIQEDKRKKFTEIVNENVYRLADIVTNLLEVSNLQAEKLVLNMREFDLSRLVKKMSDKYRDRFEQKNIEVQISMQPDDLVIYADPYRIKQILDSLLSNALKFTSEGYVKVGYLEQKENVKLFVVDTGEGINEDMHSGLFETFKRGNNPKFYGTGAGLAICKQIVNKMGGEIWYEPNTPKGSIFYVSLKSKT